ncbi:hypothetical protein FE848_00900 [Marinobacter sp. 1-3A]|uniref:hypothetical protein n=1 Tax=Marinobacter sp. 1-3A TaxID=2582920 RepID=UPI001904F03D|nr:hypothetical protein [Marinobacter sp. 1-3A]MBK1871772.1 hypothetical protein [Marinobacter sp. 1-3A]
MEDISFQHVFSRVYSYLCEAGIEMTSERCRQLLQLIDDAVAEVGESANQTASAETFHGSPTLGGHRLLRSAMDRLPEYFTLPEVRIPTPAPDLCRGSIGYRCRG